MSNLPDIWQRHAREEKIAVAQALRAEGWNLTRAARLLGVGVSTLQGVLQRHPDVEAERQKRRAS